MKNFSKLFLVKTLFLMAVSVTAQSEASVWTVDAIKTKEGEQASYLQFIEQNWATARQTLKEKGKIKSYRVLSVKPEKSQLWDVMLLTEYANREAFVKREEIFTEVFKTQKTVLINGKSGREMSKLINQDLGYEQPISSEKVTDIVNKTDIEAVKIPLNNYLQAHATGNPELIRKAFQTDARIMAFSNEKLLNLSVEEFAGRFNGEAAEDETKRKRAIEIVDISGNAATAKIVLDYPNVKFTDYMSLLKIGNEWKIVNKSFYAEVKSTK